MLLRAILALALSIASSSAVLAQSFPGYPPLNNVQVGQGTTAPIWTPSPTINGLTVTGLSSSATSCVQAAPSGQLSLLGAPCGTGSGAVTSVASPTGDTSLTVTPTTGAVTAKLNLANPNTWAATQTFPNGSIPFTQLNSTGMSGFWDGVCSTTIGQYWVRLSSGWGCTSLGWANPVWWGADPTGASDSTSAFNSALAASSQIVFPPGKFRLNSAITYTYPSGFHSVTIRGAGADNTILYWPSGNGLTFNYNNGNSSLHMRDLSLTTGTTGTGAAVTLTFSTGLANPLTSPNDFTDVTIRGDDGYGNTDYWNDGVISNDVSNINWTKCNISGSATPAYSGTGVVVQGSSGSGDYGIIYNVSQSNFTNLRNGFVYGGYIQGVTVSQTNFTNVLDGIIIPSGGAGVLSQLSVSDSQFAPPPGSSAGNGILIQTSLPYVGITNNVFLVSGSSGTIGVSVAGGTPLFQIVGNTFWSSNGSVPNAIGIYISSGANTGTISDNTFDGFNGSGNAPILLDSSSFNVVVGTNAYLASNANNNLSASNYIGVSCSGAPSALFVSYYGMTTHC